ncbi:RimJ/RimL family protein N-acetyltransferase [Alteribacter lacisalsi]|uniref:RimJ/RimL family protein N-acetyltransferase n=1 Tax=Alteribacter lacisalsi TaxID=2045244 RepID=A0A2W0HYN8_9BACI|nr:GNAT family protein [Alteribacter lacisalsi]PYZ98908.1 RimJ/RimL family protein N-acetyltransferase [Alteribacter lacisalsi]
MFYREINEHTKLEILQDKHTEGLYQLTEEGRDYLSHWMPWAPAIKTADDTKGYIRSTLKEFAEGRSLACAILYKGEVAGTAAYHVIDYGNRKTSIGYWLGENYQGKGLMTVAVRELVNYAFEELGLNRIEIKAGVENSKSRAIAERLGFELEGIQRESEIVAGRFVDHAAYSLLKSKWEKNRP